MKTSFSQTGEDLIIRFIFNELNIPQPGYIDIGAHHPFYLNNTAIFYEKGSRGLNIEPDPVLYQEFVKTREKDLNLNCGIAAKDGTLTLYVMNAPTMNTFSKVEADNLVANHNFRILNQLPIQVFSINTVLSEKCAGKFPDLLNLDVEGLDEEIIHSIDFEKSAPTVICLETISYSENGRGKKNDAIIAYLKTKGYMLYADTYINTILVLEDKWLRK